MSSHSEPYANGFGILAGILILWIGTLAVVFATGFLSIFKPSEGGEGEGSGQRIGEGYRGSHRPVGVADSYPFQEYAGVQQNCDRPAGDFFS